jgi:hypothetical protein
MRPAAVDFVRHGTEGAAARRRRRLSAFRQPHRADIVALTADWPVGEDLADSFPGLLFALATGYDTASGRQAARRLLDMGEPLKAVATVLALPLWLRRVPAQCFREPLVPLPTDEEFAGQVINRIPVDPEECAEWLERMQLALRIVGRDFALWAAREMRFLPPATPESELQWLLAWAWASRTPRAPGHALLRTAWVPAMSWKRAQEEIALWRRRIELVGALAGEARDPWFANGNALGLEFVHLATVQDFIAESAAMENCLDQYATHLAYGRVRIFSIRRAGRPVADLELTLRSDEATMPAIAQVRGPRNRRAPPLVWQAAHAWLGAQPFRSLIATPTSPTASRDALREFWTPYVAALEAAGLADRMTREITARGRRRPQPRFRPGTIAEALREVLTGAIPPDPPRE